jgi:hypothetical protein
LACDAFTIARSFLGEKAYDSLSVTLIEVGTGKEQNAQTYESDNAVHLLQGKDIVDKDLYNGYHQ